MYNILLKWVYLHGDNNLSIFICSLLDRFTVGKLLLAHVLVSRDVILIIACGNTRASRIILLWCSAQIGRLLPGDGYDSVRCRYSTQEAEVTTFVATIIFNRVQ